MMSPVPRHRLLVQVVPVGQSAGTVHGRSQLLPTSMLCPPDVKLVRKFMHVSVAGASPKMVYLTVTSPRLNTPPPPGAALLPLIVTLTSVAVPPSCMIAAPESALLPDIVTLVRFSSKSLPIPPPLGAELPLRVTRLSVAVPPLALKMPPPIPACPAQVLLLTVTSVRDRMSVLAIP